MTIVVVDAWKYCEDEDIKNFPYLPEDTKIFGKYINSCLKKLQQDHTIVHCADGREIMDEMTVADYVIDDIKDMPVDGPYYFCGFHLGRCIDRKIKELNKPASIIYNLTQLFPADSVKKINKNLNYCYFEPDGTLPSISLHKQWNLYPIFPIDKPGTAIWDASEIKRFRKLRKQNDKTWRYYNLEQDPITYRKNSFGYRTSEFLFKGNYNIAFGCSNTLGSWIYEEERYTNILEKNTGVKTYNAGVTGGSANMIMMNIASLLASGVDKPDLVIIQWPKIHRMNLPYNAPQPGVKRIRLGENAQTERLFIELIKDDINPLGTQSNWAKNYVDYLLNHHGIKNIQFAVDADEAQFYGVNQITRIDTAADAKHLGPATNNKIANYIMEKL